MIEYMPYIIAGLAAAVVLSLVLLARDFAERRRMRWERRLRKSEEDGDGYVLATLAAKGQVSGWASRVDQSFETMVDRTLLGLDAKQALGVMLLLGVSVAAAIVLWRENMEQAAVGLLVGLLLPLGIFWLMQRRWRQRLQAQLPDAFFLLARSLRAGLSLEQALTLVGEQGVRPLADEFRRTADRIRLGMTVPAALQLMGDRIQLTDFNVFTSVVTLHRQVGGNLSLLLDRVASSTRDRNQFRGTFMAATALARATAIFIALAAPVLLIVYGVFQPEYLGRFIESTAGLTALAVAGSLQAVGAMWILYLLRVDY